MTVPLLLTDELLNGPTGVQRRMSPQRFAHLVDIGSLTDAAALIRQLCDMWGGAYHSVIPMDPGTSEIGEPWRTQLRDARPAGTAVRQHMAVPDRTNRPGYGGLWTDGLGGMSPIEILVRHDIDRDRRRIVRSANGFDLDDPWAVAYIGVWGLMPDEGQSTSDPYSGLVSAGTTFDEIIRVDRSRPDEPGAADLLAALRDPGAMTATLLSCIDLPRFSAPKGSQFEGESPSIPLRFETARDCGPNVVVVYEPGSVEDLCLLWYLRSVHALGHGLPLAIPDTGSTDGVASQLRTLAAGNAFTHWGLRTNYGVLASASISPSRLDEIAEAAGHPWRSGEWTDLLQPQRGCGTIASDVVTFDNGIASLPPVTAEERKVFEPAFTAYGTQVELEVHPVSRPLPPAASLSTMPMLAEYRDGHVHEVSDSADTTQISWPSGLAVMRAVVRDLGLEAAPSRPGRMAEALLVSCDDAGGLEPLLHTGAPALLDRVGQRHGMNWFKGALNRILAGAGELPEGGEERLSAIEQNVGLAAGAAGPEGQHDITHSDVQKVFRNRTATDQWLAWAERAGLLLRGARITCDRCSSKTWRPMTDLAPPLVCFGCGREIQRPFGYDHLTFRYRATEMLLQVSKDDALVHALAFRFFAALYRPHQGRIGTIYGGYPGVTFTAAGSPDPIGEADVLFLLADGRVGIGECKTRAVGLTDAELTKLWALADRLGASFTFVATLDRAHACGERWQQTRHSGRPHFSLTAEHLLDTRPINALGSQPLAWRPSFGSQRNGEAISDADHDGHVNAILSEINDWERRGRTPWWAGT